MAEYNFREIEQKWQDKWAKNGTFTTSNSSTKPKYYVLDMFPYPSGAGLHVGHPLGYIASDIVARYKRLKGFNVLHPMGFDSFGLPAEQYAVQTGQHPAITTENNIARYKEQLGKIGFSFDWTREAWTSKPDYYKWTQWIFIQLFHSWYNKKSNKAEPIASLVSIFKKEGNASVQAAADDDVTTFTAAEWNSWDEKAQQEMLLKYRLTYLADTMVNWCPGLGTVLANEEVVNGVSERGGYPVERKKMKQWMMRITAYADRLLQGLDVLDWPEPMKEMQRNWIGKSYGAELQFKVVNQPLTLTVFTTRVDTTFGVTYISIAPESELVPTLTSAEQKKAVEEYVTAAKNRSERDRMSDVKTVSGVFTGSYAINPFNNEQVPIWIADYVLAGYGTGVVMAVPSSDERDFRFANHYGLPIIPVQEGPKTDITKDDFDPKAGTMINSGFLNGLTVPEAIQKAIAFVEEKGVGKARVQYRQRDAIFARQRYWGEPIPVYYKDGLPYTMEEKDLPLELPKIDEYKPTETGEPPLGRAKDWVYRPQAKAPSKEPHPQPLSKGEGGSTPRWLTWKSKNWEIIKEFARENRKNPTEAENVLWQELRNRNLGDKFRRQHAIDDFIVDFVCIERKLVIEADGGIHDMAEIKEYDRIRTEVLKESGYQVLRFTNEEILKNTQEVIQTIKTELQKPQVSETSPSPSERGSGGEVAYPLELSTMPGWAGSSWYFLRYMDAQNPDRFASKEAEAYWNQVDLYLGGSEHATGHLLYSRFWNLFLYDLGLVTSPEPFKKLINQGMIMGRSSFMYWIQTVTSHINTNEKINSPLIYISKEKALLYNKKDTFVTEQVLGIIKKVCNYYNLKFPSINFNINPHEEATPMHVDISIVENDKLDIEKFKEWNGFRNEYEFILEDNGEFICSWEIEKMSKSKYNVVNPDDVVLKYGADTLRLFEMFLGPLEQQKPWSTASIDGCLRFLRKLWRLFYDETGKLVVTTDAPTPGELKTLHKTIRKVEEDIERFSFNTSVSTFMVCVNELTDQKCHKKAILEPLLVVLCSYAPHIAEELWEALGHTESITYASYPVFEPKHLEESSFEYPISVNGKVRGKLSFPADKAPKEIEEEVLASEIIQKWLEGTAVKKVIVVPKKIVNVVI